jgi:hypothetical protein
MPAVSAIDLPAESAASRRAPRILTVVTTGRAGSYFLQSLFDGHPQVASLPAAVGWYFLGAPAQFAGASAVVDWLRTASGIADVLGADAAEIAGKKLALGVIEAEHYRELIERKQEFIALLAGRLPASGPVPRARAVIAVQEAWALLRGQRLSDIRLIVEHVHTPTGLFPALADFPEAFCLHMLRDPRIGYYSYMQHYERVDGHCPASQRYTFTRDFVLGGWAMLDHAPAWTDSDRHRVLRLEDLHRHGPALMRWAATWLGIDFDACLLESTLAGKPWGGNSRTGRRVNGFSPAVVATDWQRTLAWVDILRMDTLMRTVMARYDYEPLTPGRWSTDLLGLVALLLPMEREFTADPRHALRTARQRAQQFSLTDIACNALGRLPGASGLLRPLRARDSTAQRAFSALLLLALATKLFAFDPPLGYLRRCFGFFRFYLEHRLHEVTPARPGWGRTPAQTG